MPPQMIEDRSRARSPALDWRSRGTGPADAIICPGSSLAREEEAHDVGVGGGVGEHVSHPLVLATASGAGAAAAARCASLSDQKRNAGGDLNMWIASVEGYRCL